MDPFSGTDRMTLEAMTKVEKESQLEKPARFYDNQLGTS